MAACKSLQHIFEKPLPENATTLIESLSSPWSQMKSMKPPDQPPSFTEIFGELDFKENFELLLPSSPSSSLSSFTSSSSTRTSSSSSMIDFSRQPRIEKNENYGSRHHRRSESLQLCTEGLGFESCDDVEDVQKDDWENQEERARRNVLPRENIIHAEFRRSRTAGGALPPPISSIGKSGKPGVCFKSYRHDGRFVLKEIRIPNQELLHACREDGRLKLHFVQPREEILEEGEEQDDEYDDDDDEEEEEEEKEGEHE